MSTPEQEITELKARVTKLEEELAKTDKWVGNFMKSLTPLLVGLCLQRGVKVTKTPTAGEHLQSLFDAILP
jgi:hypothetical protein